MLQPFSQAELALRDTLITKALEKRFDKLARFYQIPRPNNFEETHWRNGLLKIVFGPKGTLGTTHAWLEAIFGKQTEKIACTIQPPAQEAHWGDGIYTAGAFGESQLNAVDGASPFTCKHIGRFVRVESATFGSKIYRVVGPENLVESDGVTTSRYVDLAPFDTSHWKGANWKALGLQNPAWETATATFLPFIYEERTPGPRNFKPELTYWGKPCEFRVLVTDEFFGVPKTYLIDPSGKYSDEKEFPPQLANPAEAAGFDGDKEPEFADEQFQNSEGFAKYESANVVSKDDNTQDAHDNKVWSDAVKPAGDGADVKDPDLANRNLVGGILMDEFDKIAATKAFSSDGDQIKGPFPIYLMTETAASQTISDLLDMTLAAGVHSFLFPMDFCDLEKTYLMVGKEADEPGSAGIDGELGLE
jgi:hypothetical protein